MTCLVFFLFFAEKCQSVIGAHNAFVCSALRHDTLFESVIKVSWKCHESVIATSKNTKGHTLGGTASCRTTLPAI